jgi:uncharacterized membrane protein
MINQDGIIFGLLALCVAIVVGLSHSPNSFLKKFFRVFPSVLLVYLIPALLTTFGVIDISQSILYNFNINNLLPTCLILMTLSLDLPALAKLGPKCLMVFFAGTIGVVLGGPVAILLVKPFAGEALSPDAWKVLGTLAGSWIGGGVNQASMKEALQVEDTIFMTSVAVDILVGAFFWLSSLLFLANKNDFMNRFLKADPKLVEELQIETIAGEEVASFKDYCWMMALGFGGTALCHLLAAPMVELIKTHAPQLEAYNLTSAFFWVVIFASFIGIFSSLTPLKKLESRGASKLGSVLLYLIVASIGMKIDLNNVWSSPLYFLIGFIWIIFHGAFILLVARLLRAPLFFMAVGSQANIGAAASAPIVASAFSPHLAPVGVLLSILGYVVGNYAAFASAMLMKWILN